MDAVSQQLLQPWLQRPHDVGRDGEDVVLLRAQPSGGVLEQNAEARPLGAVGSAAVPQVAEEEQHRPGRHRHGHRLVRIDRPAIRPAVRSGHDARRAVGLGEVVERPHRVDHHFRMWSRKRVDAVVGVQDLRLFAGTDLDPGRRAQLVAGAEHVVEHLQQQRMHGESVEGARLREQRVDAAGPEALEVVAAGRSAVEHVAQAVADRGRLLGRQQRLDHCVAVTVEVGENPGQQLLVHRGNAHAGTVPPRSDAEVLQHLGDESGDRRALRARQRDVREQWMPVEGLDHSGDTVVATDP